MRTHIPIIGDRCWPRNGQPVILETLEERAVPAPLGPVATLNEVSSVEGFLAWPNLNGMHSFSVVPEFSTAYATAYCPGGDFSFTEQFPGSMSTNWTGELKVIIAHGRLRLPGGAGVSAVVQTGETERGTVAAVFALQGEQDGQMSYLTVHDLAVDVLMPSFVDIVDGRFDATGVQLQTQYVSIHREIPAYGMDTWMEMTSGLTPSNAEVGWIKVTDTDIVMVIPYRIEAQLDEPCTEITVSGGWVARTPHDGDLVDTYRVGLRAGETLTLSTWSRRTLDPSLVLRDAEGNVVASDLDSFDGWNALVTYTAPRRAWFTVEVRATSGRGAYRLDSAISPAALGAEDGVFVEEFEALDLALAEVGTQPGEADSYDPAVAPVMARFESAPPAETPVTERWLLTLPRRGGGETRPVDMVFATLFGDGFDLLAA